MTSLYRQIGNGLETVFRAVLRDQLGLSDTQSKWSYTVAVDGRTKPKKLTLDGRITFADVRDDAARQRVTRWVRGVADALDVAPKLRDDLEGVVFEVRQGYKSKDSKRQNADIANATVAYKRLYLPVVLVMSNQIDGEVAARYSEHQWLVLRGTLASDPATSTFTFVRQVLGYDLGGLLQRNSGLLRGTVREVLATLLSAAGPQEQATQDDRNELASVDETRCIDAEESSSDVVSEDDDVGDA